ncbi:MAG: radical SAM/SPASM domain-containing protein [Syntrophorhabdaceae bacterium]
MSAMDSNLFSQIRSTNDNRCVQLNKGHFSLDTNERTEAFSTKLAQGWEDEYVEYRRLWVNLPETRTVREYPLLVDLELSSVCNLKCPMCYTITDAFKKKVTKGFMDVDLFRRVVDEIAGKVFGIRLSLRGEATLHEHFIECVKYAKDAGIREVSTLTNGSRLTGTYVEQVIDAGIDWITISVDGVGVTYETIRRPIRYLDIVNTIAQIKMIKQRKGVNKPVIKVQGIWPAVRNDPETFYNTFSPLTDLVAFNPLIDYLRRDQDIVYEEGFACPQLYQRLVVSSDGRVMMCSNDEDGQVIIGDAYEQSIHDIWNGGVLNEVRKTHATLNGFMAMDVCRHCYYPRKAVPNETAMVNGRTIIIENYINRDQVIGE